MNISISAHLANVEGGEICLGAPVKMGETFARSVFIGDIAFTFSNGLGSKSTRKQVDALIALSNAAIEAAHWLEDVAADLDEKAS